MAGAGGQPAVGVGGVRWGAGCASMGRDMIHAHGGRGLDPATRPSVFTAPRHSACRPQQAVARHAVRASDPAAVSRGQHSQSALSRGQRGQSSAGHRCPRRRMRCPPLCPRTACRQGGVEVGGTGRYGGGVEVRSSAVGWVGEGRVVDAGGAGVCLCLCGDSGE